jgi:hypothetical protein
MVNKDLGPPAHHRKPYTSCRALKALWGGGYRRNARHCQTLDQAFAIEWLAQKSACILSPLPDDQPASSPRMAIASAVYQPCWST